MLGCVALGCASVGALSGGVDVALSVVIGGAEIGAKVQTQTLRVTNSLGQRSTADLALVDEAKTLSIRVGQPIAVRWHGSTLFAGTIDRSKKRIPPTGSHRLFQLSCVDWVQLLDRYRVAVVYETTSTNRWTLGRIVRDLIQVQTPLEQEGISTVDVEEGPEVEKAVFNYEKVSDCLRSLAEKTGYLWFLNANKVLAFCDRATFPAPFTADDANPIYAAMDYEEERAEYRNHQFLRGGKDHIYRGMDEEGNLSSNTLPEYITGDATESEPAKRKRSFELSLPLAREPIIYRNGLRQRIGVRGVDKDADLTMASWPQWFWQKESRSISQNSGQDSQQPTLNQTLGPNEVLEIHCVQQIPMIIDTQRDAEIADRAQVEGGIGEYQEVDEDSEVEGLELGMAKAERLLDIYGRIPNTLTYRVFRSGLFPGQLQTQTVAEHGITAIEFLIQEVQIEWQGGKDWQPVYQITALDGEQQGGWVAWFKKKFATGKTIQIAENEVPVLSRKFVEQFTVLDSLVADTGGTALPTYTLDPYTFAWMGVVTDAGRTLPAFVIGRSVIGAPLE